MKMTVKKPEARERKVVAYLGSVSGKVYLPGFSIAPCGTIKEWHYFYRVHEATPGIYTPIYEGDLHITITG